MNLFILIHASFVTMIEGEGSIAKIGEKLRGLTMENLYVNFFEPWACTAEPVSCEPHTDIDPTVTLYT
jgi:hypothetical protein